MLLADNPGPVHPAPHWSMQRFATLGSSSCGRLPKGRSPWEGGVSRSCFWGVCAHGLGMGHEERAVVVLWVMRRGREGRDSWVGGCGSRADAKCSAHVRLWGNLIRRDKCFERENGSKGQQIKTWDCCLGGEWKVNRVEVRQHRHDPWSCDDGNCLCRLCDRHWAQCFTVIRHLVLTMIQCRIGCHFVQGEMDTQRH